MTIPSAASASSRRMANTVAATEGPVPQVAAASVVCPLTAVITAAAVTAQNTVLPPPAAMVPLGPGPASPVRPRAHLTSRRRVTGRYRGAGGGGGGGGPVHR